MKKLFLNFIIIIDAPLLFYFSRDLFQTHLRSIPTFLFSSLEIKCYWVGILNSSYLPNSTDLIELGIDAESGSAIEDDQV